MKDARACHVIMTQVGTICICVTLIPFCRMDEGQKSQPSDDLDSRGKKEMGKIAEELAGDLYKRLEVLGVALGQGDGQTQMEKLRCPMSRPARDGISK